MTTRMRVFASGHRAGSSARFGVAQHESRGIVTKDDGGECEEHEDAEGRARGCVRESKATWRWARVRLMAPCNLRTAYSTVAHRPPRG